MAYIVTGTVPDANVRIPQRQDSENPERVTVPSHIWTAVCYKDPSDDTQSVSFGFIGKNQMEGAISLMTISELKNQLSRLYGPYRSITIFEDDCFVYNNQFRKVQQYFNKLINQPQNQIEQMSSDIQSIHNALKMTTDSDSLLKNAKVKYMRVILAFKSMFTYFEAMEELKLFSIACLITNAKPHVWKEYELKKRDLSEKSDAVECLLVPENQMTAADGSQCSRDPKFTDICKCKSGEPCCLTPCLYQQNLKGYMCNSGETETVCSPRYSLITIKGERCLDDHPCATYGYDYYWYLEMSDPLGSLPNPLRRQGAPSTGPWDRNQGFFHITKARRHRRVTLIVRNGLPLGENPLVLSHHCRGLMCSSPKGIPLEAAAMRPNSLWNCLTVSSWSSFTLFTAARMESTRGGDRRVCIDTESQTTPKKVVL
ncbi:unnamed protein product [Leuciscus chuanchicus]